MNRLTKKLLKKNDTAVDFVFGKNSLRIEYLLGPRR